MRRPSVLVAVLVLGFLSIPAPVRACPWDPPTDPCLPAGQGEELERVAIALDERPNAHAERELEPKPIERTPQSPPLPCEEVGRRLVDPDEETRRSVLQRVAAFGEDLTECPHGIAELGAALRAEPDAFLVYRVLIAIGSEYQIDSGLHAALVGLLRHASTDVRWLAALTLARQAPEPRIAEKVVAALANERDPWVRLELAQGSLDAYEAEARAALGQLVQDEGAASPMALATLAQQGDDLGVLLDALNRNASLRATALDLLLSRAEERVVQDVLLKVMEHGSDTERVQAAIGLLQDETGSNRDAWRRLVLGSHLPLGLRAVLVLEAGSAYRWRSLACEATQADSSLAGEVSRILANQDSLFEAMFEWREPFPQRMPNGWIQAPDGASSVRCASRPLGGPPPGGVQRIPAGTYFSPMHRFDQDGVEWLAEWPGLCWIPADRVSPKEVDRGDATTPLEADLSVEALQGLDAALNAGDLELFDEAAGFTGIRLRAPTREQRLRWNSGEKGRIAVLAAVEAQARQREAERARPLSPPQNR